MDTLAPLIDHTCLTPSATEADVLRFCTEAKTHGFAGVCVRLGHIGTVAKSLYGTGLKAICVIGFPGGADTTHEKIAESNAAIKAGARELDMVLNYEALKAGDLRLVESDVAAVAQVAHSSGVALKVILETGALSPEQVVLACELAVSAGAEFVKTSTGFGPGGATVEMIQLMRATVGPHVGVKASGGVRTRDAAEAMVASGANRIGTSSGVALVTGGKPQGTY